MSGELGMSQALLARWNIGCGYMDVSEVILFKIVAKYSPKMGTNFDNKVSHASVPQGYEWIPTFRCHVVSSFQRV